MFIEVAGAIGLYLGYSILTFIHLFITIGRWVCKQAYLRYIKHKSLGQFGSEENEYREMISNNNPANLPIKPNSSKEMNEVKVNTKYTQIYKASHQINSAIPTDKEKLENENFCNYLSLYRISTYLPCAIIFTAFLICNLVDYFNYPVLSVYKSHYVAEVEFPGVTLCLWPPFNPNRLALLGAGYNFSEFCKIKDNGDNYCDWRRVYDKLLDDLPGVWKNQLDHVWKEAAWKQNEVIKSYQFAGEIYSLNEREIANDTVHLKTITTAFNRCFTFLPSQMKNKPRTKLGIKIQDLRKTHPESPPGISCNNSVEDIIPSIFFHPANVNFYWKCYEDQFSLYIFIHPVGDPPLITDSITYVKVNAIQKIIRSHSKVSLDIYDRLSTPSSPCVSIKPITEDERSMSVTPQSTEHRSKESCIHRCRISAAIILYNCHLPYVTWDPNAPLCNSSLYAKYPKYSEEVKKTLENFNTQEKECEQKCLDPCRVIQYSFKDIQDDSEPISDQNVEVSFARPMFYTVEEDRLYTLYQLVSNIGSLGSLFLGVSLYQCLIWCCPRTYDDNDDAAAADDGDDNDAEDHLGDD